jgi:cardiolipin synthase
MNREAELPSEQHVLRQLADQAFSRTSGAALVPGNAVRVLKDAAENFPAWLDAIRGAARSILFDCYIFSDDEVGREFVAVLAERARAGVAVRVIYDWLGTSRGRRLFRPLAEAGGEVRCFNPPRFDSPFGWLTRDHRKSLAVDGRIGFVSGLCVSARWLADPSRRLEAWRDTGIEIRGPAVLPLERAFAEVWAECGAALAESALTPLESVPVAGEVAVRVIASAPSAGRVLRLDQLIAAGARERLWLTDAYFVGMTPYVDALCSAARDGVDVRLLLPGASDLPVVSNLSRAGYRPLLESGVRIFEWSGTMLHAKSAISDRNWARVGSTNLNFASFLANYELDVAIEDPGVVESMARMYEADLDRAVEIVIKEDRRRRVRPAAPRAPEARRAASGSARRAAAGALSVGAAVGAAFTNRRTLGSAEEPLLLSIGLVMLTAAAGAVLWPRVFGWTFALLVAWGGLVMMLRARRSRGKRRRVNKR